jgi:DNA-binding transcriptional LysR family regulator
MKRFTLQSSSLRYLAVKGRGVFLAPSFVVADELAAGSLVRLLPDHRPVEFAINAFIDLLVERFAEHRKWMA